MAESLANVYRPTKLSEVVGQDHAVAALTGAIRNDKVPSAILISGNYGCGKTTLAQIFGRMLNCEKKTICGKCFACKLGTAHPDIITHDCAVNGKADDIRSITNSANIAPSSAYRVIIMDEVHALRDASERMLLLSTENAHAKTVWILCTTNPEKVSKTLMSRCLHIQLKPVSLEPMKERLREIAIAEGAKKLKSLTAAIEVVAASANGSMREAISKMENLLLSMKNGVLNPDLVATMTGGNDEDLDAATLDLICHTLKGDAIKAIGVIRKTNAPRPLISKGKWLLDYVIGKLTDTAKFTPPIGYAFNKRMAREKISIVDLVLLQKTLIDTETHINSYSSDETVVLSANVGKFIVERI